MALGLVRAQGARDSGGVTTALPTSEESPKLAARRAARLGGTEGVLAPDAVTHFIAEQVGAVDLDGKSVCIVVPDGTRSCPLPLLVGAVHEALHGRVTPDDDAHRARHPPAMSEALARTSATTGGRLEATYPGMTVVNHEWWDPSTFADLGTIPAPASNELSGGRLPMDVPVLLNRAVVEHDVALVVGPVFPHEVVGISGGNKYFFPGVAGQAIIDVSHWLGALITSAEIIGTTGITPVRALINEGAALVPAQKLAFCVVGGVDRSTCTRSPSATRWPPGPTRPRCARPPTSPTSTSRSVASSRSSRRCTRTSGPARRASTSSSRPSRTVAR